MGQRNIFKREKKAALRTNGPLRELPTDTKPTFLQSIFAATYCEDPLFKNDICREINSLYAKHPTLRPLLFFWGFAALPGSMHRIDPRFKETKHLKTFIAHHSIGEAFHGNNPNSLIGEFTGHCSLFVSIQSPKKTAAICIHEAMHSWDYLTGCIIKSKPDYLSHTNTLLVHNTQFIQKNLSARTEVHRMFGAAFCEVYQHSFNLSIREIVVRFFELIVHGHEKELSNSYPQLYNYMTEHINPFMMLLLLEQGANAALVGLDLEETMSSYSPSILMNIVRFVIENVENKDIGIRYLEILHCYGAPFRSLNARAFPQYEDTIRYYQSIPISASYVGDCFTYVERLLKGLHTQAAISVFHAYIKAAGEFHGYKKMWNLGVKADNVDFLGAMAEALWQHNPKILHNLWEPKDTYGAYGSIVEEFLSKKPSSTPGKTTCRKPLTQAQLSC